MAVKPLRGKTCRTILIKPSLRSNITASNTNMLDTLIMITRMNFAILLTSIILINKRFLNRLDGCLYHNLCSNLGFFYLFAETTYTAL